MFVLTRNVSAAKQGIATLLAIALVLVASGAFNTARAANIIGAFNLLEDSAPGAESNHTIEFRVPTAVAGGETITIDFPVGFDLATNGVGEDDVDVEINGTDEPTAAVATATDWGVSILGQVLTIELGSGESIGSNATVTIKVGDHAEDSGAGANKVINPSNPTNGNESYEFDIAGTMTDSGHTRVVILDTVLVTATVDTVFEFTVYGNGAGEAVNGTSTTLVSSSTTIPFGTLTAGEIETLSQDLTVETNAVNGFVVTVETDGPFESSNGADIDYFDDGATSTTPASWSSPAGTLGTEDTYGHWGVTSEDTATRRTNLGQAEFGSDQWVGIGTAPVVVYSHTSVADAATPGIGSTTVGYQVEITSLQEAADDYETVLTYIATPTF